MRKKKQLGGPSWMGDADAFNEAVIAALEILEEFRPGEKASKSSTKTSTGTRWARELVEMVARLGMPYAFGEKAWIDLARRLVGPDLLRQSHSMREMAKENPAHAEALLETFFAPGKSK